MIVLCFAAHCVCAEVSAGLHDPRHASICGPRYEEGGDSH